jgi:hypothetical protein
MPSDPRTAFAHNAERSHSARSQTRRLVDPTVNGEKKRVVDDSISQGSMRGTPQPSAALQGMVNMWSVFFIWSKTRRQIMVGTLTKVRPNTKSFAGGGTFGVTFRMISSRVG